MFLVDKAQSTVTGTCKCCTNFSHSTGLRCHKWHTFISSSLQCPVQFLWHWNQAKMNLQLFLCPSILIA